MTELEKCPMCNCTIVVGFVENLFLLNFAQCQHCGFRGNGHKTAEAAKTEWNNLSRAKEKADLLDAIIEMDFMRQINIDLRGGQGVDLPSAKTLIRAFELCKKQGDENGGD